MGKKIKIIVSDDHHDSCQMLGIAHASSHNAPYFARFYFGKECNLLAISQLTSWMGRVIHLNYKECSSNVTYVKYSARFNGFS